MGFIFLSFPLFSEGEKKREKRKKDEEGKWEKREGVRQEEKGEEKGREEKKEKKRKEKDEEKIEKMPVGEKRELDCSVGMDVWEWLQNEWTKQELIES